MQDENLFGKEERILQAAVDELAKPQHKEDELWAGYKVLAVQYRKLLKFTQKVFSISDKQGEMLQLHQQQLKNILDNAGQGFLTFGDDLRVDRLYGAKCEIIFGKRIINLSVPELLTADEAMQYQMRGTFSAFFAGVAEECLNELPVSFSLNHREIRVVYKPIWQMENKRERPVIMMILTDITEEMAAKKKIDFLRFLSSHDALTSLYNRTQLQFLLPELEKEKNFPVSMIMADMNGLKLTNDVFGHRQGDLLLIELARILKSVCREQDFVIRWGGDEFIVLLPNMREEECRSVCDKIERLSAADSTCVISVNAALGMAVQQPGESFSFERQMVEAEKSMYMKKRLMRKKVREQIFFGMEGELVKRGLACAGERERLRRLAQGFFRSERLEMPEMERQLLDKLILLHDIGNFAANSQGALQDTASKNQISDKNWNEAGYLIADLIGERTVAELISVLGERWDGSGGPAGLKGREIPFLARMFAVLHAYEDARFPLRGAEKQKSEAALQALEKEKSKRFDPELVERFAAFIRRGGE